MFQYAYSRALTEQCGLRLHTNPWVGQKVFQIDDPSLDASHEQENYRQTQGDLIYTRRQCREWFKWQPWVEAELKDFPVPPVLGHRRVGDYLALGYPVVSAQSYYSHRSDVSLITEENPNAHPAFTGELSWVPDFWSLTKAQVLLRGNSSFSWWAATLSNAEVYSPVIDGLGAGVHDCPFVPGNWPRLANLEFTTELHLEE